MHKLSYSAIGLMSGTSLDGVDLIAANFHLENSKWKYEILAVDCLPYNDVWLQKLKTLHLADITTFAKTNADYGIYLGELVNEFMQKHNLPMPFDVIGSHGHTILHQPNLNYTLQIGSGAHIAAQTQIKTVADLRSSDVAAGGQGAPIVPIGEQYLFPEYKAFLNIGGISNISFHTKEKVVAYDVCPGNTPLNLLVKTVGLAYDDNGVMARSGKLNDDLLQVLNEFNFYKKPLPRSLHTDEIVAGFMAKVAAFEIALEDKLNTVVEHIAQQIGNAIQNMGKLESNKLLVTGGGARNGYLVERIQHYSNVEIDVPDSILIDYKEALVMAFFAVLRLREEPNCIATVTGAHKSVCGGALYLY